jgi:predicted transcriptional regulator of viral defense system
MSEVLSWEISTNDLADIFEVTPQMITKLTDQGILRRVGRGRYDFREAVRGYVSHLETRILIRR